MLVESIVLKYILSEHSYIIVSLQYWNTFLVLWIYGRVCASIQNNPELLIYILRDWTDSALNELFFCPWMFLLLLSWRQNNHSGGLPQRRWHKFSQTHVTTSGIKLSLQWFIIMNHENSQPVQCLWVSPLHTNIHSHTNNNKKKKRDKVEESGEGSKIK